MQKLLRGAPGRAAPNTPTDLSCAMNDAAPPAGWITVGVVPSSPAISRPTSTSFKKVPTARQALEVPYTARPRFPWSHIVPIAALYNFRNALCHPRRQRHIPLLERSCVKTLGARLHPSTKLYKYHRPLRIPLAGFRVEGLGLRVWQASETRTAQNLSMQPAAHSLLGARCQQIYSGLDPVPTGMVRLCRTKSRSDGLCLKGVRRQRPARTRNRGRMSCHVL